MANTGKIKQVIGAVVDVAFDGQLPEIYSALELKKENGEKLVLEVQQHLGGHWIRAVAMSTTEGLKRGQAVVDQDHHLILELQRRARSPVNLLAA